MSDGSAFSESNPYTILSRRYNCLLNTSLTAFRRGLDVGNRTTEFTPDHYIVL